jgi:hypothetical protein
LQHKTGDLPWRAVVDNCGAVYRFSKTRDQSGMLNAVRPL